MHVSMMITQQERSARSRPLQRVRAGTETRWVSLVHSEDKDFKGVRAPSKEVRARYNGGGGGAREARAFFIRLLPTVAGHCTGVALECRKEIYLGQKGVAYLP